MQTAQTPYWLMTPYALAQFQSTCPYCGYYWFLSHYLLQVFSRPGRGTNDRQSGTPAEPPSADAARRVCLPLADLSRTTTYGKKSHTDAASRHRRDLYRLWPVVPEKEPDGWSWRCCYRLSVADGWCAASYLGDFLMGFSDFDGASGVPPDEVRRRKSADVVIWANNPRLQSRCATAAWVVRSVGSG